MFQVSVIIPVYNTEIYLRQCIESLVMQTIKNIELIFINDASTDGSIEILSEYKKKYPDKIKIIDLTTNIKQGGARNCGLDVASGEYIGFVDGDDFVEIDMFEKMYHEAITHNYDCVESDWFVEDAENKTKKIYTSPDYTGVLNENSRIDLILNATPFWTKIYKNSIFKENKIRFPEKYAYEDIPLIVSTPIFINSRGKVKEPLYHYIKRPESTTTTINSLHHYDRLNTTIYLLNDLKTRKLYYSYKDEIDIQYIKRAYLVTILTCLKKHKNYNIKYLFIARDNIKTHLPDYTKNKYLKTLSLYQRILMQSNDISPYLTIVVYRIFGELEIMKKRIIKFCPTSH
ncbi:MAG: glycosyltransferase [Eubacteriales bacterium]|nr:glycosyltransferase [Eubacteriales bacterium]